MHKCVFLLGVIFHWSGIYCQQVVNLEEGKSQSGNGLQYSYYITNESSKEVKGEDYERYEITLSVSNTSGCSKLIPLKNRTGSTGSSTSSEEILIAEFNCTNAKGKRLTVKKGTVNAKPWYTNARVPDDSSKNKYRIVNVMVGYAIHDGQTLTNRIVVIVPKGERPRLNCRMVYLPEIN
jgi:hypothetical protein